MLNYSIVGEVSSKKNENRFSRTTGHVFKSERFRRWHSSAMVQVWRQGKPPEPISCPVRVRVSFHHGDNRRRDGDNGLSAIMDLLVDALILKDDCWRIVNEINVTNDCSPGNPWTEIQIDEVNNENQ